MIERTYRCNLCGDAHDVGGGALYGLRWDANKLSVLRVAHQVEHHICRACYTAIRACDWPPGIEQPQAVS